MTKKHTVKIDAPAYWASALINNDWSGLEPGEQAQARQWLADEGIGRPVSCSAEFIGRWNGQYCQLVSYEFLVDEDQQERDGNIRLFVQGYVEAAFFTEGGPDDPELPDTVAEKSRLHMAADCAAFVHTNAAVLREATSRPGYGWVEAGRDFWFTRNGHGVGYWERPELDEGIGKKLTEACQYHEADFYAGDDGQSHYSSSWPADPKPYLET